MEENLIDWDGMIKDCFNNILKYNTNYNHTYDEFYNFWYDKINFAIKNNSVDQIFEMLKYHMTPPDQRGWVHFGI